MTLDISLALNVQIGGEATKIWKTLMMSTAVKATSCITGENFDSALRT